MKSRFKKYFKINLMSLIFVIVSFISVTLAWFAYSGLANVKTEINVKAWYIELEKDGQTVSSDIVVSLSEIYPGMETISEVVNIKNLGDSDANVSYKIVSARILGNPEDDYIIDDLETTSNYVEDVLSHEYPFHINLNLSRNYVLSKGEESIFEVSVSWPLDSDSDELDSFWGKQAYEFAESEQALKDLDENYQIRPSIQIVISVTAEQYVETEDSSDVNYNLGDTILFDVINNTTCETISPTCLETHIIDVNNTLGNETVTLLPNPNTSYLSDSYTNYNTSLTTLTTGWIVVTRALAVEDILKVISTDVLNSFLVRTEISDSIIGNLKYENRMSTEITKAITYNGSYKFINEKFNYLYANNCYWTNSEYDVTNGFAVIKIDENTSKIYNETKISNCNIVPVLIVNKSDL